MRAAFRGGLLALVASVGSIGATSRKAPCLRMGKGWTRLPQLGAAQQPWVAVEQLPAADGV